jgi:hypothetical protein
VHKLIVLAFLSVERLDSIPPRRQIGIIVAGLAFWSAFTARGTNATTSQQQ